MLELWPSTGRSRIWRSSIPRDELEPALLMLALPHHVDLVVADVVLGSWTSYGTEAASRA